MPLVNSRRTRPFLTFALLALGGSLDPRRRAVPPAPCLAPERPQRFPERAGTFLTTPKLGFTPERAEGHYELVIAAGDTVVTAGVVMELTLPRTRADIDWVAQTRKSLGHAPSLLGASDTLHGVRLPSTSDYVIATSGGRLGVQADIIPRGALVFVLGDHLYYGVATVFQTTVRDDSVKWRGWWWYPGWPSAGGQGYFCLRRL